MQLCEHYTFMDDGADVTADIAVLLGCESESRVELLVSWKLDRNLDDTVAKSQKVSII